MFYGPDTIVTKTTTSAFVDGVDVRDLAHLNQIAPLVHMRIPQTMGGGFFTSMQGWPEDDVHYIWLYQTWEIPERLRAGTVDPTFFDPFTVMGSGRSAIDSIFVVKTKGPAAKQLIAAVKYIVRDVVYVDFMSVHRNWRRRGINAAMLRTVGHLEEKPMVFSPATELGRKFIQATGFGPEVPKSWPPNQR